MIKRILGFITAIIFVIGNFTFIGAAQISTATVEDYTLKNSVDMEINRIEQGEIGRISVDISDTAINTNEVTASDISIISVEGSFGSLDTDSIEITSTGSSSLKYTVKFKEAYYTGTGSAITFKVKYNNLNITSSTITLYIDQCSEIDNDAPDTTEGSKQPYVEIGRSNIASPIKANESFSVQLTVKNRGTAEMKRPVLTLSMPESINSLDGMGNIQLPDIKAGTSRNVTLKLAADNYIHSASETIDITLSYNYDPGTGTLTSGTYSDRIIIPMVSTAKSTSPLIQISRGGFSSPVNADSEFTLAVKIKNIGETPVTSPVISFSYPDEIIPLDDSSLMELPNLGSGEEVVKNIRLKTKKYISSSTQEISAEVKYNYKSENDNVQGTESGKLVVPSTPNTDSGAEPLLHIVTEGTDKAIGKNSSFNAKVTINNISTTDIVAGVLNWEPGESVILSGAASVNIGTLKAGESKVVTLSGKTGNTISSSVLNITGELTYKYENKSEVAQGTENIKVSIPAYSTEEAALNIATPNIIVSQYNYGGVPIANGNKFDFNVTFKNTSKSTSIENIVMSIETDSGLSIHSASNTYYYEKMSPQGTKSQSVGMQVLPNAEGGSQKLTINFTYEYVEGNDRKQVNSSQNVSIPVYKPDKLEITLEPLAVATVGMEQTVTLNYVNKGKGELSNVKAELTGDVTALTSVQNLGNFESGKSGTINFIVVPEMPGEANFKITITYEDANLEQKTLEFPCTMTVEDMEIMDDFMDDDFMLEEEESSHTGVIIGSIIGVIVLIIIIILFIKRRKRKKAAGAISVNWGSDDEFKGLD